MKALVAIALVLGVATPLASQTPQFAGVWIGGPLDSIYNAEYERLQAACRGAGDACYAAELDTSAVRLAPVWPSPSAPEPRGWVVARLKARGAWPYASLRFQDYDGSESTLIEDVGDWGYGSTLEVAEAADGWLRPWLLEPVGGGWLSTDGGPGLGVVEGPYGMEDRLWRLGPVVAESGVELPAGVYMVLGVTEDMVRLRVELPTDMECGQPVDPASVADAPIHSVPLSRLLDATGRPTVEVAYPKGC
jgi:hypothetical protein